MNYRLAQLSDVPWLFAIEKSQPRCAQWGMSGWRTEIEVPQSCIYCAVMPDKGVGFIALRMVLDECEIVNVGVLPDCQRQGVGTALLARALAWVRQRGAKHVTLEVAQSNLPAISLYRKAGFKTVGKRKNFYPNNEDALLMEWKV